MPSTSLAPLPLHFSDRCEISFALCIPHQDHGSSPSHVRSFPGGLRWTDVCGERGRKVQLGRHHLLGNRLCQEEPTGCDDQDRLLQGLDQHHHQVLVDFFRTQTFERVRCVPARQKLLPHDLCQDLFDVPSLGTSEIVSTAERHLCE